VLILVCPKLGTRHLQEYASGNGYTAGKAAAAAALTLLTRTGRSVEYKGDSPSAYGKLAPRAPPDDQIVIGIHEVPPSQAMEMGQIMPEVETSWVTQSRDREGWHRPFGQPASVPASAGA
jgi:hypothetical protein